MKVVSFEDDATLQQLLTWSLEDAGHEIVGKASSPEEAKALVDRIVAGEVVPDAAVTDGNLSLRGQEQCADARDIVTGLGRAARKPHIIGFASDSLLDHDIPVDTDLTKAAGISAVVEFMNRLSTEKLLSA